MKWNVTYTQITYKGNLMVEIIHYEKSSKNKTIGYVDLKIPILKPTTIILRKVCHLANDNKKWFSCPAFARETHGTTNYFKYFQFETEIYNTKLLESLHDRVKEFCKVHGINEEPQLGFDAFEKEEVIPF